MRRVKAKNSTYFEVDYPDISGWATIRPGWHDEHGRCYTAHDGAEEIGSIRYIRDFPEQGVITIHRLDVSPDYRGRGVGYALIERLHADHPGHRINPGNPSESGMAVLRHIWEHEPQARNAYHFHPEVAERLGVK